MREPLLRHSGCRHLWQPMADGERIWQCCTKCGHEEHVCTHTEALAENLRYIMTSGGPAGGNLGHGSGSNDSIVRPGATGAPQEPIEKAHAAHAVFVEHADRLESTLVEITKRLAYSVELMERRPLTKDEQDFVDHLREDGWIR